MNNLEVLGLLAALLGLAGFALYLRRPTRVPPGTPPVEASLPGWLRPTSPPGPMVRAGRDADGGYVLPASALADCDGLVSLGVNDDWSFESAFFSAQSRPIDAYDPTVGLGGFLLRAVARTLSSPFLLLVRPRKNLARLARAWKVLVSYILFFRPPVRHRRLWVCGEAGPGRVTLAEALSAGVIGRCSRLMVKMDIEGAEYAALAAVPPREWRRVDALLVEFHDVDRRLAELETIARALSDDFAVRHVHPNNCCPVRDGIPAAIEVTWTRRLPADPAGPGPTLPLPGLDQPNSAYAPDIRLRFVG